MPEVEFELEKRRMIYRHIVRHPGLHLRELERRLNVSLGDLRYHLDRMEKAGHITTQFDGYRKTYFATRGFFVQDKAVLALLRQGSPRSLILHLMGRSVAPFEELRKVLGVSKSTLSFHLKKLRRAGVVVTVRREGRTLYGLANKDRVAQLLITYKDSFVDAAVDRVVAAWLP
jgi:predicted transcriptional regulator